jgi:transcriptional regulator with XRE-family HTH domain
LSQKKIATLLGYKNQAIVSHWENEKKMPNLKNFFRLAAILKIFPAEMLYNEYFNDIKHEIHLRKQKLNIWEKYQ